MAARKREYDTASWLSKVYNREKLPRLIKRAVKKLKKFRKENPFDAIAFRGYSGAPLAAILSWELNVPMIAIRKHSSHDRKRVFGLQNVESYIIVDDFISSGSTVEIIIKKIQEFAGRENGGKRVKLAAVFCYANTYYNPQKLSDWQRFRSDQMLSYQDVPVLFL